MSNAYVADKTLDDLSARFIIPMNKKQWVEVFIWNTTTGLYDNTRFKNKGDYIGAYVGVDGPPGRSGLFGEIHLVKDSIGGGYVAHEIAHMGYDWVFTHKSIGSQKQNEAFAYLVGDVTSKFWTEFYKRYEKE